MTKEEAKEAIKEAYGNSEYTDEIIKAIEQERGMSDGKWNIISESKFPFQKELKCKCDKCGHLEYGFFKDSRYSDTLHYDMPKFCSNCGDKKSNTYIKYQSNIKVR